MKGIIIQASSRSYGNTHKIVTRVNEKINFDVVDLMTKEIGFYQYENQRQDDFMPLMEEIADNYDMIVFATPLYWYSMSASMKAFLDRITECLKSEKQTGRKLRGKYMAAICCGSDADVPKGMFEPFELTAGYLGMHYAGEVHTWVDATGIPDEVDLRIQKFCKKLTSAKTGIE